MSSGTICFIPCCNSKTAVESIVQSSVPWYENTPFSQRLLNGRESMKSYIKVGVPQTEALTLYSGNFYRVLDKKRLTWLIQNKDLGVFIISAGYGIADSCELIRDYDAKMAGPIARTWKNKGLTKIIAEILLKYQPEKVFGFFAGDCDWAGTSSKYRYFFTEGVKQALLQDLKSTEVGCFYRAEGLGTGPILSTLGLCFMQAMSSDFSNVFIDTVKAKGFRTNQYPSVLVKYDRFPKGGI